jgi:hypothetical protein
MTFCLCFKMLFSLNKTNYPESLQDSTRCQEFLSCSDPRAYWTGIDLSPSRDAAITTRRQKLKSCHQALGRRVSRPRNALTLHVVTVLRIRIPRQLRCGQQPKWSSTTINRRPYCLLLEPSRNIMAKPLDNYAMSWSCVRPPEHSARVSSLGARRMLAKWGNSTNLCACTQGGI